MHQNSKVYKVLIVDDVPDLRQEIAYLLEDEGYEVSQAENGVEALKLLRDQAFDILITDMLMPKMDGIELLKNLENQLATLKIIAISGGHKTHAQSDEYNALDVVSKMFRIDQCLHKPFTDEQLLHAIASAFQPPN